MLVNINTTAIWFSETRLSRPHSKLFHSIDGGIFTARGYFVSCLEIYHSNIEHSVRAYYMLNSQVGEEWV